MFSRKTVNIKSFMKSLCNTVKKKYKFQNLNTANFHSIFHSKTLNNIKSQPNNNNMVSKQYINEINRSVYNYVQLKTISTDELLNKFSSENMKLPYSEIDNELANRVNDFSINQILVLMNTCLSGNNQFFKESKSLKNCMEIMNELWFRRPDLTASQTIQLINYVSMYKNKSKSIVEFGLHKLMNEISYLRKLSDEELSTLATATYRSSVKVNDKILRIFAYRLEKNLNYIIQNPLHFVSMIKPLKKAKYHDPILLKQLVTTFKINNNTKVLKDVTSSIHLLTYFADANCNEVTFLQELIDSIGNIMIKDNLKNYRIKDVSNYIFSVSYLGLTPKNPNLYKIINYFLNQVFDTKEKCKKRSKMLIGMCLSMWMLDYKPIQLIKFILSEVSIAALRMPNAHKQDNRLNLLLTCVLIEQPDLIDLCQIVNETKNCMPDARKHLGERPFLVKVFQTLQNLSHNLYITNVEYNFNIPHLKILGIKLTKSTSEIIYVEVLDNSTCLYNTDIPNGMMKLKFRLESKLNFNVITVNHKTLLHDTMSLESSLSQILKNV